MENRTRNLFKFKYVRKCLFIAIVIILCISCEKDNPTIIYSFQDYSFTEPTECYDTLGNKFDSLSYMFSEDDFIYGDEFHIPYENIEVIENNVFIIKYVSEGKSETLKGVLDQKNDSVYFYVDKLVSDNLLLKGTFVDNQLRISGCGYIYYTYIDDVLIYEGESKITSLKIPEIENILDKFPNPRVNNNRICYKYLYFQRFDMVYEKTSE